MNKYFKLILITVCFSQLSYAAEDHDDGKQTVCSSMAKSLKQTVGRVGGHLSFLLMPTENPTWGGTFYKASVGLGFWLTSSLIAANQHIDVDNKGHATILTDSPQVTCSVIGANLLFNAAGDAMHVVYAYLRAPTIETIKKTKAKAQKKNLHLTDKRVHDLIAENNKRDFAYISRIGQYLFNSIGMGHGIYLSLTQLSDFLKVGISPFALSFPEENYCPPSTILCHPLTTPVFLSLYMATLIYNLRELSFCTDRISFLERGDIPFFSYINAYGKIGFSNTILKRWGRVDTNELDRLAFHKKAYEQEIWKSYKKSIPEIREFAEKFNILEANNQLDRNAANYLGMRSVAKSYENYFEVAAQYEDYVAKHQHHLSGLNWFLPIFLRYYGNYQLSESAILTFKNLICYFKDFPYIEIIEDESQFHEDEPSIISHKDKKKKGLREGINANPSVSTSSQMEKKDFSREIIEDHKGILIEPKTKIKTRGTPNQNFTKPSEQGKGKQIISSTPIDSKATVRKKGLDTIKTLRNQYPVKAATIAGAIKDLEKFLDAKSETIQGSEYRLVWHINGKRYAMKYETPHGWDSTNFAGNKLDRILNVLEIGYLAGLNEDQVNDYIREYESYNLLRLGKFFYYLALNPVKS